MSLTITVCAYGVRYHVDASATGSENGLSWTNAFTHPQDAVDIAEDGDEIWVAVTAGGYTPTHLTNPLDARSATFYITDLQNGVKIYGGFLGLAYGGGGETELTQRNPEANETILNGDLGEDGLAYHVVFVEGDSTDVTTIDGFTITGGNANGGSAVHGGGMQVENASPIVARCKFVRNQAARGGGFGCFGGQPQLVNCSFLGNTATATGAAGGGAIIIKGTVATFVNCVFVGNTAAAGAGGGLAVVAAQAEAHIVNCTFTANAADVDGGAIHFAAIASDEEIFARNSAVSNCIAWGDSPDEIALAQCTPGEGQFCGTVTVRDSDVEDGLPGTVIDGGGNIDDDPEFVRAPDPGGDTDWGTADDDYGDLRLVSTSPCIDVGDNASLPADFGDVNTNGNYAERTPRDLDVFRKRVLEWTGGFIVDMGAYEFGCNENLDASNDCLINGYDLAVLLGQWTGSSTYGDCPPYLQADLNEDCKINGLDTAILLGAYGRCAACGEEELSGPQEEDPWYEQFMQWLLEEDWEAFLAWWAEE